MSIETHPFTTREAWLALRAHDLTSTEIAVLFGQSPYMTLPELWEVKKNSLILELEENERMFWGTQLQEGIAKGAALKNGWKGLRAATEYLRDPDTRTGASFDYEITMEDGSPALVEIKNVDYLQFKKTWVDDAEGLQAPIHIEMQVQHQLAVKKYRHAFICALVSGNTLYTIPRAADPDVQGAMVYKAAEFWKTIDADTPPAVDFEKDANFILSKYRTVVQKKTLDASQNGNLRNFVQADTDLAEQIKSLTVQRNTMKARIVAEIGDAELAFGPDFKVTSSITSKKERSIRVTWKAEEQQ